ncbi:MAG: type I DNA topoisomerase [Bdellovibrionales bacterium]|nr:type I DNA topoisomerase [Bdellovibrionales bacterium]
MAKKAASGRTVVIVESPTKAKTIRKFLGKDFVVESCMGHIRDLPGSAKDIPEKFKKEKWASLGVNVDQDFEPIYITPKKKTKTVTELRSLVKDADELVLATDEDREGESISWHLLEVLKPKVPVKRMVFHEITKEAIQEAIESPRKIDMDLVRAQEARRILDRLMGYTISPLLWKKIAFGLSAGRVQSVAVRLIVEREEERMEFVKSSYWGILAELEKGKAPFESRLHFVDGKRVATGKDFDSNTGALYKDKKDILHLDEKQAKKIVEEIKTKKWVVKDLEEKPITRRPYAPFITSTMQQDASRKFGWGATQTMRTAQSLYEQGFITYMRTDSTFLSNQAITAARKSIKNLYGNDYLPKEPRVYTGKKVKGAQEAHEAIRPAGTDFLTPEDTGLSGDLFKLYDLIWKRTMASQMQDSKQKQVNVKIEVGKCLFHSSGTTIEFPGFLRAYVEGSDDAEAALEERETQLPALKVGDDLKTKTVEPTSHETKPPARYTEASLIQTMEKEGIGRPSTYAPTIGTIEGRGYVKKQGTALIPTFTAMVVTNLLKNHFPQYVDLTFTSGMENSLDEIAAGDLDYLKYLKSIYFGDTGLKSSVEKEDKKIKPELARAVRLPGLEKYDFRVGRYGAYVCRKDNGEEVCASVPETHAPSDMTEEYINKIIDQKLSGGDALGDDPKTGRKVYSLTGRYGPYVQLGEISDEEEKPKRMSIPKGIDPDKITLKEALYLLQLPKVLGTDPETKKDIKAGLGRFGPYIVLDGDYRSIPKTLNVFTITLQEALDLLAQPKKGRGAKAKVLKEFKSKSSKEAIQVLDGKYGPYIKFGKKNFSLPDDVKPDDLTMEKAIALIEAALSKDDDEKPKKKAAAKKKSATKVTKKTKKSKSSEGSSGKKASGAKKKSESRAVANS